MCQSRIVFNFLVLLKVVVWTCSCLKPAAGDPREPLSLEETRVPFVLGLWSHRGAMQPNTSRWHVASASHALELGKAIFSLP